MKMATDAVLFKGFKIIEIKLEMGKWIKHPSMN